jgi:hypothetical protein
MGREEMNDSGVQKILMTQFLDTIDIRIAFREELPTTASNLSGRDINSSCDFAIYDELVATEVFQQTGTYFGRKTGQPANVDRYLRLYELIEHSAHAVLMEEGQIILASEKINAQLNS